MYLLKTVFIKCRIHILFKPVWNVYKNYHEENKELK